jgi:crossover junction endodeoxyribonuclease RuvC
MHGSHAFFAILVRCTKTTCQCRFSNISGDAGWLLFPFRANRWKNLLSGVIKMRVIGFDPGLRNTGWGIVDVSGSRLSHVANGVCTTEPGELAPRLVQLHLGIERVVLEYRPDQAAVEHTFVNKDAAGTLKLGQARAISLLVPAQHGIPVGEYAPNAVKKAVVGVGHADKAQIQHMVRMLLPGVDLAGADAADALAVAICHAWAAATGDRMAQALEAAR